MIITVALNPALDQTVEVDHLVRADINRVLDMRYDIGGKGINVARALKAIGYEALAVGFAPGVRGRQIVDQLEDSGIGCDFVYVPGEVRTNITILDRATHTNTQLALPGPLLSPSSVNQLVDRIRRRMRAGGWLLLAGSIPPPGDPSIYVDLINAANERYCQTALDADGPIVEAVLAAGALPTVLKMNEHELARLSHMHIESIDEAFGAARRIQQRGIPNVVVTLGAEGAIAVTPDGEFRVEPSQVPVVCAVGAGDAFLSGLIGGLVRHGTWDQALALASAAAEATCMVPGTQLCEHAGIEMLLPQQHVDRLVPVGAY